MDLVLQDSYDQQNKHSTKPTALSQKKEQNKISDRKYKHDKIQEYQKNQKQMQQLQLNNTTEKRL